MLKTLLRFFRWKLTQNSDFERVRLGRRAQAGHATSPGPHKCEHWREKSEQPPALAESARQREGKCHEQPWTFFSFLNSLYSQEWLFKFSSHHTLVRIRISPLFYPSHYQIPQIPPHQQPTSPVALGTFLMLKRDFSGCKYVLCPWENSLTLTGTIHQTN